MSAAKTITWERSDTYVTQVANGATLHARCGILDIAGHYWEGFERLGRVMLEAGEYPMSSMYMDPSRGPVVNPWHQQQVPDTKNPGKMKRAGILFHRASVPSDLEGCIGVGWIYADKLTDSAEAMARIYALAGGSKQNPHPIVTVRMVGARTPFSTSSAQYLKGLKPYTGL